jgi:hypothetical protein
MGGEWLPSVDLFPVAYCQHQDGDDVVLNVADYAVVTNAVLPKVAQWSG